MSVFFNNALAGASGQGGDVGYQIERSVRFNAVDSTSLSRTPTTAGNRKTWTWSGWVKRTSLGSYQNFFGTDGSSGAYTLFQFLNTDGISLYTNNSAIYLNTTAVFRDTSAWMHIVVAVDTTAAVLSDRCKLYVNGTQITAFSTTNYPTQNIDTYVNSTVKHTLGTQFSSYYFNGYLADVHLIDGQALTPSSFGEFDTNGVWQPKAYTGTYGTNGFHLPFSDNSTAAALGTDTSGNGNTWTVNNIAVNNPTTLPAVAFDGTGDYLRLDASTDTNLNGDFTIEAWVYPTANGEAFSSEIVSRGAAAATNGWHLGLVASSTIVFFGLNYAGTGATVWTQSTNSISLHTWSHIAVTRSGNTLRIFLNGVLDKENTGFTGTPTVSGTEYVYIGRASYDEGSREYNGFISNLHIVKGTALYTASFTPPTAPITSVANTKLLCCQSSSSTTAAAVSPGAITANGNVYATTLTDSKSSNDSLVDSPTNYGSDTGAGAQVRGNYATFSPLAVSSQGQATLANGNLDISGSGVSYTGCVTGFALSSGKWYWEYTTTAVGSVNGTGIIDSSQLSSANGSTYGYAAASRCWYRNNLGQITNNSGAPVTGLATLTNNDVVNVAVDFDAGKLWFGKNGTWDGSGNPATGANASITFTPGGYSYYALAQGYGSWSGVLNAGARVFAYTAPSGFKALCTTNLPTPTIADGSTAMDVALYTGNGSTQTITTSFSPDLVWIKERSGTRFHALCDSVRGDGLLLYSNSTLAEQDIGSTVVDLTSTGFNLGYNNSFTAVSHNWNSVTHVAWAWDAGSSTVTNTSGSISSQVRANASAGFSVVTYTGTGANATVGHGLGVAPDLIILKRRDGAGQWYVYHRTLGATKNLYLNTTDAQWTISNVWNNTAPTSSVFSVGDRSDVNGSGTSVVAYCFAPVAGYSAFGSYVGNGSADGPMVFCNFRPAFVLIKSSSAAGNWMMYDYARGAYNLNSKKLAAASALVENDGANLGGDTVGIDFLSNGFKIRTTGANHNDSSVTYVYACFAENPFSLARAR